MRPLLQNATAMLAALIFLVSSIGPAGQCAGRCCCSGKAAASAADHAKSVLHAPGCCGCSISKQADGQQAMPEFIGQGMDGQHCTYAAAVSAEPYTAGPASYVPVRARGSTAGTPPQFYKLFSAYLC